MKRQIRMKYLDQEFTVNAERSGNSIIIERDGTSYTVELIPDEGMPSVRRPTAAASPSGPARAATSAAAASGSAPQVSAAAGDGADAVCAPMTGTVKEVRVQPGDTVDEGQVVIVMEAMKMEMEISAHRSGTVGDVLCAAGDSVKEKQALLRLA